MSRNSMLQGTYWCIVKDKSNHGRTWLIAFGEYEGGCLWVESPIGSHAPLTAKCEWQKALRGDYYSIHSVHEQWVSLDPQLYHCVEPGSLAPLTPRNWKRIPPHCLGELMEIGFCPPFMTLTAEASATALHVGRSPSSSPTLAARLKDDELALKAFGPLPAQAMALTHELSELEKEDVILWGASDIVSSLYGDLPYSDGSTDPLTPDEMKELEDHIRSGHVTKSNMCRGCLEAEGPRRIHRGVRDVENATQTLDINIAGSLPESCDNYSYFLVGASRLPGLPLVIEVRLLATQTSVEVCDKLEKMIAFFESLQAKALPLGETRRIKRLHSDRAGEFTAPFFARLLQKDYKTIYHTLTTGYDPQPNGAAERSVGLIRSLATRALASANLEQMYWSCAVRYVAQSLLCHALQKAQRSLPFGTTVVTQVLGHR